MPRDPTVTVTTRPTDADHETYLRRRRGGRRRPHRLEWEGGSPDRERFLTRHVWTLTETPDGTDLHHYETFHGTDAQATFNTIKVGLRRDFERFNTGLKAACENGNHLA